MSRPPPLRPELQLSKIFRFQTNGPGGSTVTVANLLNVLVTAVTAGTTARLIRSIRLRKVEAWSIGALGGTSENIQIVGFGDGPSNMRSDSSMGVTPAHVTWRPAPASRSALWYDSGVSETDNLFSIDYPQSAIVDVTLELILASGILTPGIAGPATAGATALNVYGCTLDGTGRTGGGKIQPVDFSALL
jgi:hypothetical protein